MNPNLNSFKGGGSYRGLYRGSDCGAYESRVILGV